MAAGLSWAICSAQGNASGLPLWPDVWHACCARARPLRKCPLLFAGWDSFSLWVCVWVGGWVDGWVNGWVGGGWMYLCVCSLFFCLLHNMFRAQKHGTSLCWWHIGAWAHNSLCWWHIGAWAHNSFVCVTWLVYARCPPRNLFCAQQISVTGRTCVSQYRRNPYYITTLLDYYSVSWFSAEECVLYIYVYDGWMLMQVSICHWWKTCSLPFCNHCRTCSLHRCMGLVDAGAGQLCHHYFCCGAARPALCCGPL